MCLGSGKKGGYSGWSHSKAAIDQVLKFKDPLHQLLGAH